MPPQTLTLAQMREPGLAVLHQPLGSVGLERCLQPSAMGWGNDTEERDPWRGDPDLDALGQQLQAQHPDQET